MRGREGRGGGGGAAQEERKRKGGWEEGIPGGHTANHWPAWDSCLARAPPLRCPDLRAANPLLLEEVLKALSWPAVQQEAKCSPNT